MGIIAWIILGIGAGLLANMLIPGRRSQGLIITCLIGIAGALGGGWAATKLFHIHTLHGFFNASTWVTAIVPSGDGAARRMGTERRMDPARRMGTAAAGLGSSYDHCCRCRAPQGKPGRRRAGSGGSALRTGG
ncbi:MAG: hypothetical protein ABJB47_13650 [Actinomycetota bacterium]